MNDVMAMRATSLAVSAALMGAAVLAALTMSITFQQNSAPDLGTVIRTETLPPPNETPRPTARPLTRPQIQDMTPLDTPPMDDAPVLQEIIQSGPTGPVLTTITRPDWVRRPSGLQAYYPRRALQRGLEGAVQLDCLVDTAGALHCNVVSETPTGWDFGEAALRISRAYRMVPAMRDGAPVEARYQMRVPFQLE